MTVFRLMLWTGLHVLLAIGIKAEPWVGTVHGLVVLSLGVYLALCRKDLVILACWAAYVAGAEVAWRMGRTELPWEIGKYGISMVFALRILFQPKLKSPWLAVIYFVLLLPAATVALVEFPFDQARKHISFNLSGPLCLAVCAIFFANLSLDIRQLNRIQAWLVIPVVTIAYMVLMGVRVMDATRMGNDSNFEASGGYGPNQVSGILSLGALCALLLTLTNRRNGIAPWITALLGLWFMAHAALSFSRTGVYLFGIGLLVAVALLPLRITTHWRTLTMAGIIAVGGVMTWLFLVDFTGGMIEQRFGDSNLTGRDELVKKDLDLWMKYPLFGAGIGVAVVARGAAGHTEYTRLVSEHGLLGLLAMFCLAGLMIGIRKQHPSGPVRAGLMVGFVWATLSMLVGAMRTASPSLMLAMALVHPAATNPTESRGRRPGEIKGRAMRKNCHGTAFIKGSGRQTSFTRRQGQGRRPAQERGDQGEK